MPVWWLNFSLPICIYHINRWPHFVDSVQCSAFIVILMADGCIHFVCAQTSLSGKMYSEPAKGDISVWFLNKHRTWENNVWCVFCFPRVPAESFVRRSQVMRFSECVCMCVCIRGALFLVFFSCLSEWTISVLDNHVLALPTFDMRVCFCFASSFFPPFFSNFFFSIFRFPLIFVWPFTRLTEAHFIQS